MTRAAWIAGAVGIMLTGGLLAGGIWAGPARAADAQTHWQAMTACAGLDDTARHACTDGVLRAAGLLQAAPAPAPAAVPAAPGKPVRPAVEARDPVSGQTPDAPSADDRSPNALSDDGEITLARAMRRGDGRLVLTATDGVVWRQLYRQGSMPIPRAGDTMAVRLGALNGYICAIALAPSFRCRPDP